MKRLIFLCLVVALAVTGGPVLAGDDIEVKVHGGARVRFDHFEDYDFNGDVDDNANVWPYRAIVGLTADLADGVMAQVDFQTFGDLGDNFSNTLSGYPYAGSNSNADGQDADVYQAFLGLNDIGDSGWSLRVGRSEFKLGNELHFGNNDFTNGRTFDGAWLMGDYDNWKLNFMYLNINELGNTSNFPDANAGDDDSWIFASTANFDVGAGTIEPYVVQWRNGADGSAADVLTNGVFGTRIDILTLGALWSKPADDDGGWDASAEIAMQTGDFGISDPSQADFGGTVFEGEFGWTFDYGGRIHLNILQASGDDDGTDTDIDTFVPIAPDVVGARLGYSDAFGLANIQDISLGYDGEFGGDDAHSIHISIHQLSLAEEDETVFSPVSGAPVAVANEDDLGQEFDIVYGFDYSDNAAFEVGAAFVSAGDYFDDVNEDGPFRAWAGLTVHWGHDKK